jgi:hypothetical protein
MRHEDRSRLAAFAVAVAFGVGRVYARQRERAAPPLPRACAASARIARAPAKSTSDAARVYLVHWRRAGANRPSAENRPGANARFASPSNARTRHAAAARWRTVGETRAGAGEEHERRRAGRLHVRRSRAGAVCRGTENRGSANALPRRRCCALAQRRLHGSGRRRRARAAACGATRARGSRARRQYRPQDVPPRARPTVAAGRQSRRSDGIDRIENVVMTTPSATAPWRSTLRRPAG